MKKFLLQTPWAFGLITVSGLIGAIGAFLVFVLLRYATGAKSEKLTSKEFFFTGILTGVVERFFFTVIIGLLGPAGVAQAAVAWVAIKGQVHYKMFSEASKLDISRAYLGLLGSIVSMLFAILGGHFWKEGIGLDAVLKWFAETF